jgi:DNA-binding CsgD family transcriptional regulator
MLKPLVLRPMKVKPPQVTPARLQPLIAAASQGEDLIPVIQQITHELGFDNFMHGVSLSMHPNAESHSFVFTTLPLEWVALYDQKAYIEVDPRIEHGLASALPFVWDQASLIGKSRALDAFLADAERYGVASGVSVSTRDFQSRSGITALSSTTPKLDAEARNKIAGQINDILALGTYFHELVVMAIMEDKVPPMSRGAPLSPRERQCLLMSANGMSSLDISKKLGIAERTANFHFSNIVTKLNVLNRKEAVARAIAQGIIHLES